MKKKYTICLVTNWYPTEENPYQGVFFKEQAYATSEYFDFIVLHVKEKYKITGLQYIILRILNKNIQVFEKCRENNVVEYNAHIYYSVYSFLRNKISNIWQCEVLHRNSPGVGIFCSPKYYERKKKAFQLIYNNFFANKIDAFYCVDAQTESLNLQILAEVSGKPYVVSEHAPIPWPGTVIDNLNHDAIECADAFIAISQDKIRQALLQNLKLPCIYRISNYVDETQFQLAQPHNGHKTFIIVAANSFYKNYDFFLTIMNRLTEMTEVPFRVMVVGYASNKGYSHDPEGLEAKIKASKIADRVAMIPEVSHTEIQNYYSQADAFIMTSIQEGFPVSAVEAACCGLPIFSTRCGGVEDYVTEEIGRILPIYDSENFAWELKKFLEGEITFNRKVIREKIVRLYGRDAFVKKFTDCFMEVIEMRNREKSYE